jgi:hypothetical protein
MLYLVYMSTHFLNTVVVYTEAWTGVSFSAIVPMFILIMAYCNWSSEAIILFIISMSFCIWGILVIMKLCFFIWNHAIRPTLAYMLIYRRWNRTIRPTKYLPYMLMYPFSTAVVCTEVCTGVSFSAAAWSILLILSTVSISYCIWGVLMAMTLSGLIFPLTSMLLKLVYLVTPVVALVGLFGYTYVCCVWVVVIMFIMSTPYWNWAVVVAITLLALILVLTLLLRQLVLFRLFVIIVTPVLGLVTLFKVVCLLGYTYMWSLVCFCGCWWLLGIICVHRTLVLGRLRLGYYLLLFISASFAVLVVWVLVLQNWDFVALILMCGLVCCRFRLCQNDHLISGCYLLLFLSTSFAVLIVWGLVFHYWDITAIIIMCGLVCYRFRLKYQNVHGTLPPLRAVLMTIVKYLLYMPTLIHPCTENDTPMCVCPDCLRRTLSVHFQGNIVRISVPSVLTSGQIHEWCSTQFQVPAENFYLLTDHLYLENDDAPFLRYGSTVDTPIYMTLLGSSELSDVNASATEAESTVGCAHIW